MKNSLGFTQKSVEFAYPSSEHAKRFGFAAQGCHVVEVLREGDKSMEAISGHADRADAIKHALEIECPWSGWFLNFNHEDGSPK